MILDPSDEDAAIRLYLAQAWALLNADTPDLVSAESDTF